MDKIDYSFMETGFQNLQGIEQLSNNEKAQKLSMISLYYEEAIKIAESYVIYENRSTITANDIILALKVQALDRSAFWRMKMKV